MKCTVIGNRILVEPLKPAQEKSVIITPEMAKRPPTEGIVLAIGNWCSNLGNPVDPGFEIGDRAVFSSAGPSEVVVDGRRLLVIDERDVLVVFPKA